MPDKRWEALTKLLDMLIDPYDATRWWPPGMGPSEQHRAEALAEVVAMQKILLGPYKSPRYGRVQIRRRLQRAKCPLSFREREIIRLRFGLSGEYAYTYKEIGNIFQICNEHVRQIVNKAVGKLRISFLRTPLQENCNAETKRSMDGRLPCDSVAAG